MRKIFIHANVITVDCENEHADAFVVEKNRFLFVGSEAGALRYQEDDSQVIDLQGNTVIPGFNDSHCHLLNYAYGKSKIDLTDLRSPEEVIERSKQYILDKKIPKGKWLVGRGWSEYPYPNQHFLTREDLDLISTEHPILFTRVCEHTVVLNTLGLSYLGIDDNTPNPTNGKIQRDQNGKANGVLNEAARYLAYEKMPDASVEEIKEMLTVVMEELPRYGLTSVQSDDFETFSGKNYENVIRAYRELIREGKMKLRVYEQCLLPQKERYQQFLDCNYHTGVGDNLFKIGPLKLLVDGSAGPKTAFLQEEYSDDPGNCGICNFTQEQLDEMVALAQENGMHVLCHGIGDAAIERILNSYEKAIATYQREDPRLGIVHVQITTRHIWERMKKLGIIAYSEPVCVGADMHCVESRIGKERMKEAYAYRTMYDMGIRTTLSSDCPIDSINPLDSAYIATTRKDLTGYPEGGWYPDERLNIHQVLRGFTLNSAYASFEEGSKGSITTGKLADFVVLSQDLLQTKPDDLRSVKVLYTYMDGVQTFSYQ